MSLEVRQPPAEDRLQPPGVIHTELVEQSALVGHVGGEGGIDGLPTVRSEGDDPAAPID